MEFPMVFHRLTWSRTEGSDDMRFPTGWKFTQLFQNLPTFTYVEDKDGWESSSGSQRSLGVFALVLLSPQDAVRKGQGLLPGHFLWIPITHLITWGGEGVEGGPLRPPVLQLGEFTYPN